MDYRLMHKCFDAKVGGSTEKAVLLCLVSYIDIEKGTEPDSVNVFASLETIQKRTEFAKRAVINALKSLEQSNYISIVRRSGKPNSYTVNTSRIYSATSSQLATSSQSCTSVQSATSSRLSSTSSQLATPTSSQSATATSSQSATQRYKGEVFKEEKKEGAHEFNFEGTVKGNSTGKPEKINGQGHPRLEGETNEQYVNRLLSLATNGIRAKY